MQCRGAVIPSVVALRRSLAGNIAEGSKCDPAGCLYHFRYDLNIGYSLLKRGRITREAIEQRRKLQNLLQQSRMLVQIIELIGDQLHRSRQPAQSLKHFARAADPSLRSNPTNPGFCTFRRSRIVS